MSVDRKEKRCEWLVQVNDWMRSRPTWGAMWADLRIEIATRAFLDKDQKRDESDSYWNISRREERPGLARN